MSKRYTDSEKFSDLWYRKLSPKHKCLWEFLLSKCNLTGIIELDFESMSFHIGEKITEKDLAYFQDRVVFISDDKLFIPKFIKFQQGELNENNPAHKNIIKELKKIGLDYTLDITELKSTFEDPSKGLGRDISNVKVMYSKGKGNVSSNKCAKNSDDDFDFISDLQWKELFSEWIDYKKSQFSFVYKSKKSLSTAFDELVSYSNNDLQVAKKIVGKSISSGWKGLFELKDKGVGQNDPTLSKTERTKDKILKELNINNKGEEIC